MEMYWLVGGFFATPLKNMCKSNWIISPRFGMNIKKYFKPPPTDVIRTFKIQLISDTVDGRNPANHLGCRKPCKKWDKLPFPQLVQDFFHQQYNIYIYINIEREILIICFGMSCPINCNLDAILGINCNLHQITLGFKGILAKLPPAPPRNSRPY